jgi:hypothetical protein
VEGGSAQGQQSLLDFEVPPASLILYGSRADKDLERPCIGAELSDDRSASGRPLIEREVIGLVKMLPEQGGYGRSIRGATDDIDVAAGSATPSGSVSTTCGSNGARILSRLVRRRAS